MDMMPIEKVLSRLSNVKQTDKEQWSAQCPCHEDSTNSLSVGLLPSQKVMAFCHACGNSATLSNIATSIGLTTEDFFPPRPRDDFDDRHNPNRSSGAGYSRSGSGSGNPGKRSKPYSKIVATYDYRDEDGKLLFQACRMEPKKFRQRQKLDNGNFVWNMEGVRYVLYRLPELLAYKKQCQAEGKIPRVIIVEGEKDVDRLRQLGYCATTNVGGAQQAKKPKNGFVDKNWKPSSKWKEEYSPYLVGCDVVISPDNDDAGFAHRDQIGGSVLRAAIKAEAIETPTTIRVVEFPQPQLPAVLPKGYDVSDYLDGILEKKDEETGIVTPAFPAMGDAASLANLIETAAEWIPPAGPEPNSIAQYSAALEGDTQATQIIEAEDDPHRLARINFERYRRHRGENARIVYWREEWFKWSKNTYERLPVDELRSNIIKSTKEEFDRKNIERQASAEKTIPVVKPVTKGLVANVYEVTKSLAIVPAEIELNTWSTTWTTSNKSKRQSFIALENGVLDIDRTISDDPNSDETNCLHPHTPNWFSTVCLPYQFDATATCPKFTAFLDKVMELDPERIKLLQEWAGYCLTTDTTQQKFLILEGDGGNGKSVFLAAIGAMLGKENCSYVPMEQFGEKFATTPLLGKLLNICSDVGELDSVAEGWLKSYTGGGPVAFDRKFKDALQCIPTARLMLSCNVRPRFKDRTSGIWRRMLIVPFKYKVTEEEKIYGMEFPEWWLDQGELPGIFNWALQGLARLRAQRRFTDSEISTAAIESYQRETNPTREFLLDNLESLNPTEDPSTHERTFTRCQWLREFYTEWCDSHGYHALGDAMFNKEIERIFPTVKRLRKRINNSRPWIYQGLRFREAEIDGKETYDKDGMLF